MKHRHLSSIYWLNGLILSTILLLDTFVVVFILCDGHHSEQQWLLHLFRVICILPIFTVFALKTWLIYFEQQYQMAIMNITWLKEINSMVTDWFISNRNRCGNFNYLLAHSMIIFLIQIACYLLVHFLWKSALIFHILTVIFTSLPLLVALILFCKVRGFDDIYGIKDEIKYQCVVVLVILMVDLALFLSFEYIGSMVRLQWILCISFMNLSFLVLAMLSTAYPVFLNEYGVKDPNDPSGGRRRISSVRATGWKTDDFGVDGHDQIACFQSQHLLECISSPKWFMRFMHHLVSLNYINSYILYLQIDRFFGCNQSQISMSTNLLIEHSGF